MAMRKLWKKGLIGALAISMLAACSDSSSGSNEVNSDLTLEEITKKAKEEGNDNSVGMQDTWEN